MKASRTRWAVLLGAAGLAALAVFLLRQVPEIPAAGPVAAALPAPAARRSPALPPPKLVAAPAVERPSTASGTRWLTFRGRVADAHTGAPLAGTLVSYRIAGAKPEQPRSVMTDADGTFTFTDECRDGWLVPLRFQAPGGYLEDFLRAKITADLAEVDLGTLRLVRGDWPTRFGKQRRGFTGIENELRGGQVFVTGVRPGTPAARAGLRVGERIVSADGVSMAGMPQAARSYLLQGPVDSEVALQLADSAGNQRQLVLRRQARVGSEYTLPTFGF